MSSAASGVLCSSGVLQVSHACYMYSTVANPKYNFSRVPARLFRLCPHRQSRRQRWCSALIIRLLWLQSLVRGAQAQYIYTRMSVRNQQTSLPSSRANVQIACHA